MTNNEFKYKQLEQAGRELAEQKRHSQVLESLESGKLNETIRHQQMQESIDRAKADEAYRHDVEMERLQGQSNEISRFTADTQRGSALYGAKKAAAEAGLTKIKTQLEPMRYLNEKQQTEANVRKSGSDIYVNEKNADTREYDAQTKRLTLMKDTVLGAGNFVLNAVGTASGAIGKLASLL